MRPYNPYIRLQTKVTTTTTSTKASKCQPYALGATLRQ